jgi:hypothetical protein
VQLEEDDGLFVYEVQVGVVVAEDDRRRAGFAERVLPLGALALVERGHRRVRATLEDPQAQRYGHFAGDDHLGAGHLGAALQDGHGQGLGEQWRHGTEVR